MASTYSIAQSQLQAGTISLLSTPLTVYLVADSYVFDTDDALADITAIATASISGRSITVAGNNVTFDASNTDVPTTTDVTAGWAIICTPSIPVFAIDIGTITTESVTVQVVWDALGIATGIRYATTPTWMEREVANAGNDYNSDYTTRLFSRVTLLYPDFACSFAGTEESFVNAAENTGAYYQYFYDAFGNDADNQYTMRLLARLRDNNLFGDTLFDFSVYDTGEIGGMTDTFDFIGEAWAPIDASANYTFPANNLTPLLTALRSSDFTTTTLDIQNTDADSYDIQIQAASNQQGTFGGGYDETDAVTNLPFTDTVVNIRLNYKYRGRFQINGNINGNPVTVNSAWSAPRYTLGKGNAIV